MAQDFGGLSKAWDTLRSHGLQNIAPQLVRVGVKKLDDLPRLQAELTALGVAAWQIDTLLSGRSAQAVRPEPSAPARWDVPRMAPKGRASFSLALEAASLNNRKRALEALDESVLAASTKPAVDSRVKTYEAICVAWQVAAWPISHKSLRCFAASLKHGRYRSAHLYFGSIFGHQCRALAIPVDEFLKQCAKSFSRSITRGLGPSKLKESFDLALLSRLPTLPELRPFDMTRVDHSKDVAIFAAWFMLRELELAGARFTHLYLQGSSVSVLLPQHKTDQVGNLTVRTLQCACRVRRHELCPYHAAERHLVRVQAHPMFKPGLPFPLVPTADGNTAAKTEMIDMFRNTIAATGTALTRPDDANVELQRFGGHVMRVAGAQFLCHQGVAISTIQLLGRWTSNAIERYLQSAPLLRLQHVAPTVLHGVSTFTTVVESDVVHDVEEPIPVEDDDDPVQDAKVPDQRLAALGDQVQSLFQSLDALKGVVEAPDKILIHRKRSTIVHEGESDEKADRPAEWRTKCGWAYGFTNFFRLSAIPSSYRKCRKCFRDDPTALQSDSESDADTEGSDSSSSSS